MRAWLELDQYGEILFVPSIGEDEVEYVGQGSELGAEMWAVNQGYKLVGGWEYADRLDGTMEIRRLIEV